MKVVIFTALKARVPMRIGSNPESKAKGRCLLQSFQEIFPLGNLSDTFPTGNKCPECAVLALVVPWLLSGYFVFSP